MKGFFFQQLITFIECPFFIKENIEESLELSYPREPPIYWTSVKIYTVAFKNSTIKNLVAFESYNKLRKQLK